MAKISRTAGWWLFAIGCILFLGLCGWAWYEADQDRPGMWIDTNCAIRHPPTRVCAAGTGGNGCLFGIFIGMTENYGSTLVPEAAPRARNILSTFVETGLMRPEDGIVLTNREATSARVLAAFRGFAPRVRRQDVFVFFFDGHGGVGELGLWKSRLGKNRLSSELNRLAARQRLVVLNGCYSGSFAGLAEASGRRRTTVIYSSACNQLTYGDELGEAFGEAIRALSTDGLVTGAGIEAWVRYQRYGLTSMGGYYQPILGVGDKDSVLWRAWSTSRRYSLCSH